MGAGTGTTCFGYKAGVGTSSRAAGGHALGCLVVSNYGARRDLHLLVGPDASCRTRAGAAGAGRLDHDRAGHRRAAVRAPAAPAGAAGTFGLGRAGSFAANASGEYVIAFSTAHRVAHRVQRDRDELSFLRDDSTAMRDLFEAAGEVVQESVLNSLCVPDAVEGRDGNRAEAFPTCSSTRFRSFGGTSSPLRSRRGRLRRPEAAHRPRDALAERVGVALVLAPLRVERLLARRVRALGVHMPSRRS